MGWIRYPACFSHSAIFGPPSLAACLTLWCCSPFTCLSSCLPVSPTATCPSACLQATCPSAYLQATCPPACLQATCPPVCLQASCPPACLQTTCPPVCLPLYSNQSSHQSAICQAEYCSFYLIPDKQIRPTLLSHSTALFSLSLPQKLVMNGGYSWLLVSVHGV